MKKDNQEAKAFDLRIRERIANGHIPDLRRVKFCEWFYNNHGDTLSMLNGFSVNIFHLQFQI